MRPIGQTLLFALVVVVLLQGATALTSVWLLQRMSPAIEHILEENDRSLAAVEAMSLVLASGNPALEAAEFDRALTIVGDNVTEEEERPAIEILRTHGNAALQGDTNARRHVAQSLRDLSTINRAAMHRADEEAKRLGFAGSWVVVFLGLLGFFVGLFVIRRVLTRLLTPIREIATVLKARSSGDIHRRVSYPEAPEFDELFRRMNLVLDGSTSLQERPSSTAAMPAPDQTDLAS